MRIRAVVFDAVGTIIRPVPSVADVYCKVGRRLGSRLSLEEICRRFPQAMQVAARHDRGFATNEEHEYRRWQLVVNHVFHDLSDTTAVFADLWQHFAATSHWQLYDDVEPIWEELQAKSTKLAIGSNFDRRLQSICEHLSTLRTCQQVFWSAQIGVRKPGRGFFDHIARRLECEAENLLMVGDDVANDYHGAISAGWHARWIDRGATMTQLPRSHRLESLTELLSLLAD